MLQCGSILVNGFGLISSTDFWPCLAFAEPAAGRSGKGAGPNGDGPWQTWGATGAKRDSDRNSFVCTACSGGQACCPRPPSGFALPAHRRTGPCSWRAHAWVPDRAHLAGDCPDRRPVGRHQRVDPGCRRCGFGRSRPPDSDLLTTDASGHQGLEHLPVCVGGGIG